MRESELIEALQTVFRAGSPRVVRGMGDDAAVVRGGGYAVTSMDMMVDGVHFRVGQLTMGEIGHRAIAAALSDLAAMGVEPSEAYLALGLAPATELDAVVDLAHGVQQLGSRCGVVVAGGDVTRANALTVSATVIGWATDPGGVVGRDGAKPGDLVCVTGQLGEAGAGLAVIEGRVRLADQRDATALRERYARPSPRLEEGCSLAALGARAMIDLSDGLATDAGHLAHKSGVKLELQLAALPVPEAVTEAASQLGESGGTLAATAGEDFELCACVPPGARSSVEAAAKRWRSGARLTWIGQVLEGPSGLVFTDAPDSLAGYQHCL
jgi:thiamine-monophosphate kinase